MDRPEAWVMRVATNLALDQLRKKRVYADPPTAAELEETVTDRTIVRSSIAKLPRRQREVVAMRFLADMPEDEVARVLGVTTGSVKTHLHRALTSLRVSLASEEAGGFNADNL